MSDTLEREVNALTAERDQLLRDYEYDHKCLHEVRERCESWKQRAELAEAEVERSKHGTVARFKDAFISELKRENAELREWQAGVIANEKSHHAERKEAIARAEKAEAELDGIRALADRRNKRYHEDTTHQLVAALDQALDIAQAELATAKERLRSEAMDDYASIKDLQRELATERARMDWLESPAGFDWQWHSAHSVIYGRSAIDAAMKEGAK